MSPNPKINEQKKIIQTLEKTIEKIQEEKEGLFNTFRSLNLITKNANALYSINDFDIQCKFNYVSPSVKKIGGYEPEEMIGKSAFDFVHPKDKKLIILPLMKTYLEYKAKKLLKGELRDKSETFYYRCKDKWGEWRYVETTSNLVGDKLIMVTTDIGEQKKWENKLKQTQIDFNNLLTNLNDIYFRIDQLGIISDINPIIEKIAGFKPKELLGKPVSNVFRNDNDFQQFINEIKTSGTLNNYDMILLRKDGSNIHVSANVYILRDNDGKQIGLEGILRDNTERKEAELNLQKSERNMAFLASSAFELINLNSMKDICQFIVQKLYEIIEEQGMVFIVDYDYDTEMWEMQEWIGLKPFTKKLVGMLGFDISTLKGNVKTKYNLKVGKLTKLEDSLSELTRGIIPSKLNDPIKKLISLNDLYCIPFQKDGEVQGNITIITNYNTKPINSILIEALISQVSNFYAKIKIDKELQESKERYKALYESSTQAIAIANDEGRLLEANPEFLKLFKINDIDQLRKLNPVQISPEYQPNGELSSKLIAGNIKNAIKKGFTHKDWIHKKLDGTEFPTEIEITKFLQDEKIFFQTSVVDLTNQIKAEEQFKDLVEKADIGISIEDDNGNFTYLNSTYCNIVGYTFEELKNKPVTMILHPDDSDIVMKTHDDRIAGKQPITDYNFKAITKDGDTIHLRVKANEIIENGIIVGTRSYIWDVTDKIKSREALRESEEKFSKSFKSSPYIVGISTLHEGKYVDVNDEFVKATGFSRKEIIGKTSLELGLWKTPQDRNFIKNSVESKGNVKDIELELISKNGKLSSILFSAEKISLNGEPHLIASGLDITDKKIAEAALVESENKFSIAFQSSPYLFIISDIDDGKIIDINAAFEKITGYSRKEVIGKTTFELDFWKDLKKRQSILKILRKEGSVKDFETNFYTKNGEKLITLFYAVEIMLNGKPHLLASIRDITEKKQSETALMESEQRFRLITDLTSDLAYGFQVHSDGSLTHLWATGPTEKVTGYDAGEITEMGGWEKIIIKEDLHIIEQQIKDLFGKKDSLVEYRIKRKDNKTIWVRDYSKPVLNPESKKVEKIYGSIKEITEQKTAELELFDSQQKYQDLYDYAPDMYFSVNPNGIIASVNEFGANHLGYKKEELVGKSVWMVVHPDDLKEVKSQINKIINAKSPSSEIEFRKIKKDGSILYVQEKLQCILDETKNCIELRINCRDITDSKLAQDKIIDYQRNLKSLSNALLVAEEKERKRLAITLHDTIGQTLAITKIKLTNLENSIVKPENVNEIKEIETLVTDAIKESRNLTYELSPPILYELGLFAACTWYIDQLKNQYKIKINIIGDKNRYNINEKIQIILYRSIRELLNNVIKHAQASQATLTLKRYNQHIKVMVNDNGIGVDVATLNKKSIDGNKFGLFSVTERIEYVGGSLEIKSILGKGTKITINVPI